MEIELNEIKIREVVKNYVDNAQNGCKGYGGRLNIRPAFQREFIYKGKQRDEVIKTVMNGFPLNVMYWVKSDDGNFEMLDGQQRTISICQYVNDEFSLNHMLFSNLPADIKEKFLDYKLMIYICDGTDSEKLAWFKIINIAGMELTAQELRNAIYTGKWLTEAKKHFSKANCPAQNLADDYLNGKMSRQAYLETALKWISARDNIDIEHYMGRNQHESNCNELWLYFQSVINWVQVIFPNYRKEMRGLEWGILYNKYHERKFDAEILEKRIVELMEDEDVTNSRGIYEYLLSGDEKHLNIRKFSPKMKRAAYERQRGICAACKNHFELDEMHADHITPWSLGGKTTAENCQVLCADCNRRKSNI